MTWELRGFAENGTILFRMDGTLASTEGDIATFFFGPVHPFTDGVLARCALSEGEKIYFAGHLSGLVTAATLAYHHPTGVEDEAHLIPQEAEGSILKKLDLVSMCFVVELKAALSSADMSWVNNLPHGTLTGDIWGDMERMAKVFGLMAPYWKAILPSVKTDTVSGDHLDEMLNSKLTTWSLGLPYYGCLAWLFSHLWETRTFNTAQHQFIMHDDYSLTVTFSPILLPKHPPSRN